MILDQIILENFGAYSGVQRANLTPEPGCPIVLFGGLNGGGKTTMLDALQLVLYGSKAHLSNRGRQRYDQYLRDCIHRGVDSSEGASIKLGFRRSIAGKSKNYEIHRSWRVLPDNKVEEQLQLFCDGIPDEILTEHWAESIENHLPASLAHLFFFDGEQIKELADGENTSKIIGTAVHSLLGLDLVERLDGDLKNLESRKRKELPRNLVSEQVEQTRLELEELDNKRQQLAEILGKLSNDSGRLKIQVQNLRLRFQAEGGELFLRRQEIEETFTKYNEERIELELLLREHAAGVLPLLEIEQLLLELQEQSTLEEEIHQSRSINQVLEHRDFSLLELISKRADKKLQKEVQGFLESDRQKRSEVADKPLLLEADEGFAIEIEHLRTQHIPKVGKEVKTLIQKLKQVEERITRVESELDRIPAQDQIAQIQSELTISEAKSAAKSKEIDEVRQQQRILDGQLELMSKRLRKFSEQELEVGFAAEDQQRVLKHSFRVRNTLEQFRIAVLKRHSHKIENLMFQSLQQLLRKQDLVSSLRIDPNRFDAQLNDQNGQTLPFERLSAGERQLLATSMLWGLARASGRPIPTVIDTPLGRLDSAHRKHLVERYFPAASHQVILLSTDEEIVGEYYQKLKPHICRNYLLAHDSSNGTTTIQEGYFS